MIKVESIKKSYGNKKVLDGISFELEKGELIFLKGRSGSGKSTLLSIISLLNTQDSGKIYLNNIEITKLSNYLKSEIRNKKFGIIFQTPFLIEHLSVASNIAMPLLRQQISQKEIEERVINVAKRFKIEHKLEAQAISLSGGEAQRVAACRALIANPEVILADEPTANLDIELTLHFIEILKEFKNEGKTVIVATHDVTLLESDIKDKILDFDGMK